VANGPNIFQMLLVIIIINIIIIIKNVLIIVTLHTKVLQEHFTQINAKTLQSYDCSNSILTDLGMRAACWSSGRRAGGLARRPLRLAPAARSGDGRGRPATPSDVALRHR